MDFIQTYKDKSDSRTREYLKNNHGTLVELSSSQKEKLKKLTMELAKKEIDGKKVAEKTGIPENIAALDVVKIAMMMGLVKSKRVREGMEPDKTFSLMDLFKSQEVKYEKRIVDFKDIPFQFSHSPVRIFEEKRLEIITKRVKEECSKMTDFVSRIVKSHVTFLNTRMVFNCENNSLESFRREAINILNDHVESLVELSEDDRMNNEQKKDEIDEILLLMNTVRNHLFGFFPVESYTSLILSHVRLMKKLGVEQSAIFNNLSPIESFLIQFKGFNRRIVRDSEGLFKLELQIRSFSKDQRMRPFEPSEIQTHLCSPALLFVHVQDVVQLGLIGPFNSNSIGYSVNGNYYLLKEIKYDVRMWVVDEGLKQTKQWIRQVITEYLTNVFKNVYRRVFGDNEFRSGFLKGRKYFYVALVNLLFVNSSRLSIFLTHLLQKYSPLIPTELDVFNSQKKRKRVSIESTELDRRRVLRLLFDKCDTDSFTAFLNKYF